MALTIQHSDVLPRRRGRHILLLQQIHIVDDGRQRRFDVVGHVGDELCLHALGACLLVDGLLDAGLDALQIFLVLFERGQPAGNGLALVIGLPVGDGLPFLL